MSDLTEKIKKYFPVLGEPALLEALEQHAKLIEVPAGTIIIEPGSYIKVMPLVTKGAIKVLREDERGGELFLYFLYPGQSCVMTLQCCMTNAASEVRAIAEEDTEFIAIPIEVMDGWMKQYNGWKNFIMLTYSERFNELLQTIDSLMFQKLDERLIRYLEEKATVSGNRTVKTTHQDIAYDLHSSREVISRLLKQLEKAGKIRLYRNQIELI